jgi:hypothetical protein
MKVVIQHANAALFWSPAGSWTKDPRRALMFLDKVRAQDYVYYHDIDRATAAIIDDARLRHTIISAERRPTV